MGDVRIPVADFAPQSRTWASLPQLAAVLVACFRNSVYFFTLGIAGFLHKHRKFGVPSYYEALIEADGIFH